MNGWEGVSCWVLAVSGWGRAQVRQHTVARLHTCARIGILAPGLSREDTKNWFVHHEQGRDVRTGFFLDLWDVSKWTFASLDRLCVVWRSIYKNADRLCGRGP